MHGLANRACPAEHSAYLLLSGFPHQPLLLFHQTNGLDTPRPFLVFHGCREPFISNRILAMADPGSGTSASGLRASCGSAQKEEHKGTPLKPPLKLLRSWHRHSPKGETVTKNEGDATIPSRLAHPG